MIFLISYFSGIKGSSTSEWADDKYNGLCSIFGREKIRFFTSLKSNLNSKNIIKIPSISFSDFKDEIKNKKIIFPYILFGFIPITFGIIIDLFLKIFIKGVSESRWSWSITSCIFIFIYFLKYKPQYILTSGGAASAHLTACILRKIFKFDLYIELQDPLIGNSIGRNSNSEKYFIFLEKLILSSVNKLIFVSKNAHLECKSRNPKYKNKIFFIYPGASKLKDINYIIKNYKNNVIKLIHLGTLYNTRNLNNLFIAIDNLINKKSLNMNEIRVHNQGDIYCKELNLYKTKKYFTHSSSLFKNDALQKIKDHNALLLIQHTDERSKITIPYKIYDYLHFNLPIFGLINNNEINSLLDNGINFCTDNNSIEDIEKKIIDLKNYISNNPKKFNNTKIDLVDQIKKIFI